MKHEWTQMKDRHCAAGGLIAMTEARPIPIVNVGASGWWLFR